MKHASLSRTFLLFLFYASLLLTVPQYVECEDLYPDEISDFVGVPVHSVMTLKHEASAILFSDRIAHFSVPHRAGNLPVALYIGKLALSVTLLC